MTLTSFIKMSEVSIKLRPLHPKMNRNINKQIKINPRSNNSSIIGTAFDYLLRFEIKRRYKNAVMEPWLAEGVLQVRRQKKRIEDDMGPVYNNMFPVKDNKKSYIEEVFNEFRKIVGESKEAVNKYIHCEEPSMEVQISLADYAIRLAKIDIFYRSGYLDPEIEEVDQNDKQDLVDLLSIVPFGVLINSEKVILNPGFGESTLLVDGADADLITGDLLVDIKTTSSPLIKPYYLDQLLGYYFLARLENHNNPNYPVINRVGLYFSRHGYLWKMSTSIWINNPLFSETEEWFIKKAKEVFTSTDK
ncbi:MAG: hypothetical protein ABSB78_14145 [Bacteroidota bacterium]